MLKVKMTKSQFVPNLKKMDEITALIFLTSGSIHILRQIALGYFWPTCLQSTYLPTLIRYFNT